MKPEYSPKPIAFENANSFNDLFSKWTYEKDKFTPIHTKTGHIISSYCSVSDYKHYQSLFVLPSSKVIADITKHMFPIENDSIYFKLTFRGDGTVLVSCEYNKILGSRWLAVLSNTDSIPKRVDLED